MPDSTVVVSALGVLGIAITALLGWLGTRGNNTETRRMSDRERLSKLEQDVTKMRDEITSLHEQLKAVNEKWSGVIGTIREMFWDVYQQWPAGHAVMRFRQEHVLRLRKAEVDHIIPADMHHESESETTP